MKADRGWKRRFELHDAVMALSPEHRRDRAKVNEAGRQAEHNGDRSR